MTAFHELAAVLLDLQGRSVIFTLRPPAARTEKLRSGEALLTTLPGPKAPAEDVLVQLGDAVCVRLTPDRFESGVYTEGESGDQHLTFTFDCLEVTLRTLPHFS